MSVDKRIANKLENLIYKIECLGIQLDKPASHMTLSEYEDKCKEIIESCAKSIEEMLDARTCSLVDNESGLNMHCTVCGREVDDEYRYFMERWGYSRCPHCGRRIEVCE